MKSSIHFPETVSSLETCAANSGIQIMKGSSSVKPSLGIKVIVSSGDFTSLRSLQMNNSSQIIESLEIHFTAVKIPLCFIQSQGSAIFLIYLDFPGGRVLGGCLRCCCWHEKQNRKRRSQTHKPLFPFLSCKICIRTIFYRKEIEILIFLENFRHF